MIPWPKLNKSWNKYLKDELSSKYMRELNSFLETELQNKTIYPEYENLFAAYNQTPLEQVKVVILGQDPYHGENQAHGLSFSVRPTEKAPPSLKNIYKELSSDLGIEAPQHGHLIKWANQGVFLLNTVLSVEASKAGSHRNKGWEQFTDKTIQVINDQLDNVVFILWGSPAAKKEKLISNSTHLILKSAHPSPLSAYRGFFNSRPFSKTNSFLTSKGKGPIDWSL